MSVIQHPFAHLPGSRGAALEVRSPWFFTGRHCKHGHLSKRHVVSQQCYECAKALKKRTRSVKLSNDLATATDERLISFLPTLRQHSLTLIPALPSDLSEIFQRQGGWCSEPGCRTRMAREQNHALRLLPKPRLVCASCALSTKAPSTSPIDAAA